MVRAAASAGVSSLALSATALAQDHAVLRGRLVFSDHKTPVVEVLDLDSGKITHSFPVPGPGAGFGGAPTSLAGADAG